MYLISHILILLLRILKVDIIVQMKMLDTPRSMSVGVAMAQVFVESKVCETLIQQQ